MQYEQANFSVCTFWVASTLTMGIQGLQTKKPQPTNQPTSPTVISSSYVTFVSFPSPAGQFCCGLFVLLILGNFWFLGVLYLVWLYIDWETPRAGGRRSQWVRNWTVWNYFREYFPIQVGKRFLTEL